MKTDVNDKTTPDSSVTVYLAAYEEVCKSYHAIDEFRMKLLGFLPLASLIGIFLIDLQNSFLSSHDNSTTREIIGFAAIFAAALTLALFGYEIRGIRRCHNLIIEGRHIEQELGIGHGQFHVCAEEHKDPSTITKVLNAKFVACAIYSLVFTGWLFITLRFGFGIGTLTCSISAVAVGLGIAMITYISVRKLTAS